MTTTTLHPQTILRQAIGLLDRLASGHTPQPGEVDRALSGLIDLSRRLPDKANRIADIPPLHEAARYRPTLREEANRAVEEYLANGGEVLDDTARARKRLVEQYGEGALALADSLDFSL